MIIILWAAWESVHHRQKQLQKQLGPARSRLQAREGRARAFSSSDVRRCTMSSRALASNKAVTTARASSSYSSTASANQIRRGGSGVVAQQQALPLHCHWPRQRLMGTGVQATQQGGHKAGQRGFSTSCKKKPPQAHLSLSALAAAPACRQQCRHFHGPSSSSEWGTG